MKNVKLCANIRCPLKKECGRQLIKPHPTYQVYGDYEFKKEKDGSISCEGFVIYVAKAD